MKALSLDDRDRLVAVCNLKTPLLSLMLSLIKKNNNNNNGEKNTKMMFRVFNRSGRAGRLWFSLFRMAGGGSSMLEFCGE